jgi:hypothetical protein
VIESFVESANRGDMSMARIKKDKSTAEKLKFWTSTEAAIEEIKRWPEGKQSYVSPFLLGDMEKKTTETTKPNRKRR